MIDEVQVYRIVGVAFLVVLPVALVYVILPARTLRRKRIRLGAVAFIGLGSSFIGLAASWPGPNSLTLVMMGGGTASFLAAVFFLARSFIARKAN